MTGIHVRMPVNGSQPQDKPPRAVRQGDLQKGIGIGPAMPIRGPQAGYLSVTAPLLAVDTSFMYLAINPSV